jgi:peptidoglycan/LPS O-acetylase OafA/YrhL
MLRQVAATALIIPGKPASVTQASAKTARHLPFLDGLRGVLAFYVLVVHFVGEKVDGLPEIIRRFHFLTHFGHAAVDSFIVLSGYSLMLRVVASPDKSIRGGLTGYLERRARRILPPYYAALGFSIAVLLVVWWAEWPSVTTFRTSDLSFTSIVSHVLMIHTLVPGQNLTINMALWSVATEEHIYFLFPTLLLPLWRRLGSAMLLAVALPLACAPFFLLPANCYLFAACPWYVGLFSMGMVGAAIGAVPDHPLRRPNGLMSASLVGVLVFFAAGRLLPAERWGIYPAVCLEDLATGVVACCVLVYCAGRVSLVEGDANRHQPSLLVCLLQSRPAVLLGSFSYSLYATHCAVLTGCHCLTGQLGLDPLDAFLVRIVAGIPLAVLFAYGFSRCFEAPFLKKR